jgi:PAS domain S-box-containing protein
MVGWSEEELVGAIPPFVYWTPEEMEVTTRSFQSIIHGKGLPSSLERHFQRKDGTEVTCEREEEVYRTLGLPWIPPELREDRGEVQAAIKVAYPT